MLVAALCALLRPAEARAYKEDTHYHLTFALALKAGFSAAEHA